MELLLSEIKGRADVQHKAKHKLYYTIFGLYDVHNSTYVESEVGLKPQNRQNFVMMQ
jgi:hypothetical protein